MRIALLSDIHGNVTAFDESINFIKKNNIDIIIFVGDYITDFPNSNQVVNKIKLLSKSYKTYIIKGNREDYIVEKIKSGSFDSLNTIAKMNLLMTYDSLSSENLDFISNLPDSIQLNLFDKKIYISHKYNETIKDKDIYIFGHTHIKESFIRDNCFYINPGSVGLSFPQNHNIAKAEFSILNISEIDYFIEDYSLSYDILKCINNLKTMENNKSYIENICWNKALSYCLITGKDVISKTFKIYNEKRAELDLINHNPTLWNNSFNQVISKYSIENINYLFNL